MLRSRGDCCGGDVGGGGGGGDGGGHLNFSIVIVVNLVRAFICEKKREFQHF